MNKEQLKAYLESEIKGKPAIYTTDGDRQVWLSDVVEIVFELLENNQKPYETKMCFKCNRVII
jgi:hypothetical protein